MNPVAVEETTEETVEEPIDGRPCPNCGTPLTDRYCGHCGQRVTELRPTLHELVHEALHEFSHVDGKIVRTLGLLLFRPGQLTREFFDGKRARSVTPIRLYLIASLLFFGVLALLPPAKLRVNLNKGSDARLVRAAERINRDPSILAHALATAFPKAMFILMPLFGLLVYAFYWRAERMYVPHFYFAVHYHAFTFVILALFGAVGTLHWAPLIVVRVLLLIAPLVYLAVALRTVYGGGRLLTIAKTTAIVVLDLTLVFTTMIAIALITVKRFA
jgi:hypothetical protein